MGKKGACVIPQTLETNVVKLHQFLFGTEDYVPSETVKSISKKIAADSGMYKEGNYVKSVNTDGGVIQPPKTTAAETKKAAETEDDDRYEYINVLNSSGKKVKKRVPRETDEDGEYIEQETDENGIATGWVLDEDGELVRRRNTGSVRDPQESSVSDRPGLRPTDAETDENGDLIDGGERLPGRPGDPSPTESTSRPGLRPTDSTDALRPTSPETGGNSQDGPGGGGSSNQPGNTEAINPSPQTTPTPGGNTANPVNPTSADNGNSGGPGGGQAAPALPSPGASSPGGGAGGPTGGQNPGMQGGTGGVVSAPGQ